MRPGAEDCQPGRNRCHSEIHAMVLLYNFFQILALILFFPFVFVKIITSGKYRSLVPVRLGFGLDHRLKRLGPDRPRIWVHALSVGEVSSAQSLVRSIRAAYPGAALIFSATTLTGMKLAAQSLSREVDLFIHFPLDFFITTNRFLTQVDPDLFILVETDFWPNFMHTLKRKKIPALLVNGRISTRSHDRYQRFRFFFAPLFSCFRFLSMQTAIDAERMRGLGIPAERIKTLGNLKYDAVLPGRGTNDALNRAALDIDEKKTIWLAGSTHAGEEEIIFQVFSRLGRRFPALLLIIAPRHIERTPEVLAAAKRQGLTARCRTGDAADIDGATVLILDTIGELASLYRSCDLAFVGGSLVAAGGHNPLEPAAHGRPVLFGPHMEDFQEIARDLVQCGGGRICRDGNALFYQVEQWLADPRARKRAGANAAAMVAEQQGVSERHLQLIKELLVAEDQGESKR
ncbi:MAG: 3-deoxy-D-manno-octulosonic acid transferase [Desulfobacterales bacterium]|nr:3-deoxy-D-manno-octulosonic acid transferase [Desulfobacterales bacterium]